MVPSNQEMNRRIRRSRAEGKEIRDGFDSVKEKSQQISANRSDLNNVILSGPVVSKPEIMPLDKTQLVKLVSFPKISFRDRVNQTGEPNKILGEIQNSVLINKVEKIAVFGPSSPQLSGDRRSPRGEGLGREKHSVRRKPLPTFQPHNRELRTMSMHEEGPEVTV